MTEAFWVWAKIGLLSFGGPTGQIALMHRELVERRRWISDGRFLHALNYCMLLPGPEAQQLAVYIGWLLHRAWGGVIAGALFVLPGAALMWLISVIYVWYGKVPIVEAVFYGLKPAVIAIVAGAVLRLGMKALKNLVMWSIAGAAFVAIFVFDVSFPLIILAAALSGWLGGKFHPRIFDVIGHQIKQASEQAAGYVIGDAVPVRQRIPLLGRTVLAIAGGVALWLAPVAVSWAWNGYSHVFTQEGLFFSKAALVTFGGAYAVLPYVAQQAVETHGWLNAAQMMDGLALAETTPGPLILVLQFVGFLGGWNNAGPLPPLLAATLGAAISSWVTFVPSFLFIMIGAPYVEKSRGNLRLNSALSAVTAAVVGVVLNLSVWFSWHAISPTPDTIDLFVVGTAILYFLLMRRYGLGVLPVIGIAAVLGMGWRFSGLAS